MGAWPRAPVTCLSSRQQFGKARARSPGRLRGGAVSPRGIAPPPALPGGQRRGPVGSSGSASQSRRRPLQQRGAGRRKACGRGPCFRSSGSLGDRVGQFLAADLAWNPRQPRVPASPVLWVVCLRLVGGERSSPGSLQGWSGS